MSKVWVQHGTPVCKWCCLLLLMYLYVIYMQRSAGKRKCLADLAHFVKSLHQKLFMDLHQIFFAVRIEILQTFCTHFELFWWTCWFMDLVFKKKSSINYVINSLPSKARQTPGPKGPLPSAGTSRKSRPKGGYPASICIYI